MLQLSLGGSSYSSVILDLHHTAYGSSVFDIDHHLLPDPLLDLQSELEHVCLIFDKQVSLVWRPGFDHCLGGSSVVEKPASLITQSSDCSALLQPIFDFCTLSSQC